jgi:hypothetical protein
METVLLGQGGEHQDGVIRINYKSDFPLEVKVVRNGVAENFPDADFTLTAKTEGGFTVYKAERKAGVYSHCKRDGERLIMFFDNHGLAKGRLIVSAVINHPDADYTEDGIRQENLTTTTNIELVEDNGDALQLQLPEPRVVEKEVEKIVEKEVDKYHYTDLQKKAAAWVNELNLDGEPVYPLILDYFLKNITDVGSLVTIFQGGYMNGANETDPDFNEKLKLAKFCFDTPYLTNTGISCFEGMNAPHLDLDLLSMGQCDISNSFNDTIVNTISITAQGYFAGYIYDDNQDKILQNVSKLFVGCVSKKVSFIKSEQSSKNVYYYLATIKDSKVECFEFEEKRKEYALDINIVAEKILPDVSQDEHKPKLIFRNVVGTVNEELKQKILAKGYPSVEFYEGENKVL